MLRVAICDDEESICLDIKEKLEEVAKKFLLKIEMTIFNDGKKLLEDVTNSKLQNFDIIFLDINLKETNGIIIGEEIRKFETNYMHKIVYVSSVMDYAMRLFKIRAFDFIIKPISPEQIEKIIEDFMKYSYKDSEIFTYTYCGIKNDINLSQVSYFESNARIINIHTNKGKIYNFYGKLDELEHKINKMHFIRIHKSLLVNYNHIKVFNHDCVELENGLVLYISRSKRMTIHDFVFSSEMKG